MLNRYLLSLMLSFSPLTLFPTIELADYDLEKVDISPIENNAKGWAKKCAEKLTPSEMQACGNFFYFIIQVAEMTTRYVTDHAEFYELLKEHSQGVHLTDTLTKISKKSLQLNVHLLNIDDANECMQRCIAQLDEQNNPFHEDLIHELEIAEEAFVKTVIKQKSDVLFHLEKDISPEKQITDLRLSLLEFIKSVKEYLSSDELFAGHNSKERMDNYTRYLIQCNTAIHHLQSAFLNAVNQAGSTTLLINKLQNLRTIIYKIFYKELHQQIMLLDQKYQTICFNADGPLTPENQSLLPSPDSFFADKK